MGLLSVPLILKAFGRKKKGRKIMPSLWSPREHVPKGFEIYTTEYNGLSNTMVRSFNIYGAEIPETWPSPKFWAVHLCPWCGW